MFDLSKVSIVITPGGVPFDISAGLVIDSDFFKITKEQEEEVKSRKGTRKTAYNINSEEDDTRLIEITYLPNSPAVKVLEAAKKNKTEFPIFVRNASEPDFTFTASRCHVVNEPETVIHGKDGFKDKTYKIRALDGQLVFA